MSAHHSLKLHHLIQQKCLPVLTRLLDEREMLANQVKDKWLFLGQEPMATTICLYRCDILEVGSRVPASYHSSKETKDCGGS